MQKDDVYNFLTRGLSGDGLAGGEFRPPLKEAFSVYKGLLAPKHRSQVKSVGELADFVEVLRGVGKASMYSDEEWIAFFRGVKRIDEEEARDLWDALVCQPEY